jgi:hypothetical protein
MAKTDAELATEAAARADAAANQPRDPRTVRSSIRAAAAAARAAIPEGAGRLNEPVIADAGTGVVPQPGAGHHEGERAPAPASGQPSEVKVTIVNDEEYDALEAQQRGERPPGARSAEGEEPTPGAEAGAAEGARTAEGEAPPAGEAGAEEWPTVAIPARNAGQPPVEVEVEDPELAADIMRMARGYARTQEFHRAMTEVEARQEELAQFEDALRIDPVNLIMDKANPNTKVDLALALMSDPAVFNKVVETFGGLDGPELQNIAIRLENQRLTRASTVIQQLRDRSQTRVQGREIDAAIQRMIPDDMDARAAGLLYNDLRRDATAHIMDNGLKRLPIEQLPEILAERLALYGVTVEEAADRLQDTETPLLPVTARTAGREAAPARNGGRQPARTGERLVAQAAARARAGAVPGGGAGVPAQAGWALPQRQGVKGRIASLREILAGAR